MTGVLEKESRTGEEHDREVSGTYRYAKCTRGFNVSDANLSVSITLTYLISRGSVMSNVNTEYSNQHPYEGRVLALMKLHEEGVRPRS